MGFLTKLAFKNLFRYKLRTFVSIVAIAFSVMVVVFARGYVVGVIDTLAAEHIQYDSGHIKLIDRQYWEEERLLPLNYPVDGLDEGGLAEMTTALLELEGVAMVIPRLKFGAMLSTEEELITISGWGVEPEQETVFTNIEDFLVEGRMPRPGQFEVMMGTALLEKINRRVGEKVTIVFNTAFNSLKGVTFTIVGRTQSGIKLLNEKVFYLPLDQAQRLLEMDGQVTELLLVTTDRKLIPQVQSAVNSLLTAQDTSGRYLALSYRETSDLVAFMEVAKLIYNQIYIFLVLLACIVVINTMLMIVKERTKEIGMMSALGLEGSEIIRLFMAEGTIMGVIGSLIGAALGAFLTGYFAKTGINFTEAVSGFSSEIIFNAIIYPHSSPGNTIFAFILGVIIVTIACVIPARRAARLEPTVAMGE
ncbi:MAG: ABC transporter permease [Firmicutes bacterium]|nr:ABC transporter permease [Bacillota bacterium]